MSPSPCTHAAWKACPKIKATSITETLGRLSVACRVFLLLPPYVDQAVENNSAMALSCLCLSSMRGLVMAEPCSQVCTGLEGKSTSQDGDRERNQDRSSEQDLRCWQPKAMPEVATDW